MQTRNEILDAIYEAQNCFRQSTEEIAQLNAKIRELDDLQVQRNIAFANGSSTAALRAAARVLGEVSALEEEIIEAPDDNLLALQGLKARLQKALQNNTFLKQEHYMWLMKLADHDALDAQVAYRAASKAYINSLAKLCALDESFSRHGIKRYCGISGSTLMHATLPLDAAEVHESTRKGHYKTEASIAYLLAGPKVAASRAWEKDLDAAGVVIKLGA